MSSGDLSAFPASNQTLVMVFRSAGSDMSNKSARTFPELTLMRMAAEKSWFGLNGV